MLLPKISFAVSLKERRIFLQFIGQAARFIFLVMTIILQTHPQDEPVFQFMNKKRLEGKPYKIYMMASTNKFLHIYYARVKAVMGSDSSK